MKYNLDQIKIRAKKIMSNMDIDEKIGQIPSKIFGWHCFKKTKDGYELTQEFKDMVKKNKGAGHIYGMFRSDPWSGMDYKDGVPYEDRQKVYTMIQDYVLSVSPNKIPVMFSNEGCHGGQCLDSTTFPVNLAMGCSFNRELMKKQSTYVSEEFRSTGTQLMLTPGIDICRDPRWGRVEECFGEDPYLSYEMCKAIAEGTQGDGKEIKSRCITTLKHVCSQGACEGGRNLSSANIGERDFREIHLESVRGGIEGGAMTFMAAYNDIDGILCHANKHLFRDIIEEELGFQGTIMADGCGNDRISLITNNDFAKNASLAIKTGISLGLWDESFEHIKEAYEKGYLLEEEINEACLKNLTLKLLTGLYDDPYKFDNFDKETTLPLEIGIETPVLVKNDGILPLRKTDKILNIGSLANSIYSYLGDYTSTQERKGLKTFAEQIAIDFDNADYALSYYVTESLTSEEQEVTLDKAKKVDTIIAFVGGSSERDFNVKFADNGAMISSDLKDTETGEGVDLSDIKISKSQEEFIEKLYAINKNIVLIVSGGRPYSIEKIEKYARGIIYTFYNGECAPKALTEILLGNVNPSGKFPITVPRSSNQLPVYYNERDNGTNSKYTNETCEPLYPFGYGLSYTKFEYSNLVIKKVKEIVKVSVDVKNTGDKDGKETVLLFIRRLGGETVPRRKELKAFKKVFIKAGEKLSVEFSLDQMSFRYYNNGWKVADEEYKIKVDKLEGLIKVK